MLFVGIAVSIAIGYVALDQIGVPQVPHGNPRVLSALGQESTSANFLAISGAMIVSLVVGLAGLFTLGKIRVDAGVLLAASALIPARIAGGPMRLAYMDRPQAATLWSCAIELFLLSIPIVIVAFVGQQLIKKGALKRDDQHDELPPVSETVDQKFLATFCAFTTAAFLLMLFLHNDAAKQSVLSVLFASGLASAIAFRFIPAVSGLWLFPAPLLCGIIAYSVTAVMGTANLSIGEPTGFFGSLARAAPLDYASVGVVGAVWGYWIGRSWTGQSIKVE